VAAQRGSGIGRDRSFLLSDLLDDFCTSSAEKQRYFRANVPLLSGNREKPRQTFGNGPEFGPENPT
jgi:hypothetical protein